MNFDFNKDGSVNFSDLWAFLTQKLFGLPLYLLLLAGGGAWYYFFGSKKKRYGRR